MSLSVFLQNLFGFKTKRKIIVIHSDDWGSIRMPSNEVRLKLAQHKQITVTNPYSLYDTLASATDLEMLFETLNSVKDSNNHPAIITANCVVANPDFEKIKENGFETYFHEPIQITFERYNNLPALNLWKEGMAQKLFYPQFHGREHVNVPFWMKKLKEGHHGVHKAFDYGVFGVDFLNLNLRKSNFQAAWDFDSKNEHEIILESIKEGLLLFEKQFGYKSKTVIPPSYTWDTEIEHTLKEQQVIALQGILSQKLPLIGKANYHIKYHFFNSLNSGLGYQKRNVFFEPTIFNHKDQVSEAIKRIALAFKLNKPAVISSHRLNFIGVHDESNRVKSLKQFQTLLKMIVKKWSDVEFMHAEQLADIVTNATENN